MLWYSPSILIDGTFQKFSSTTVARQKYFLSTFEKMGYNKKQLKELLKHLYDFGGKRIEPVRVITLPVSFGTPKPPRTKYITLMS
jgi:hypothetical protein